jgi:hypothetical protein
MVRIPWFWDRVGIFSVLGYSLSNMRDNCAIFLFGSPWDFCGDRDARLFPISLGFFRLRGGL